MNNDNIEISREYMDWLEKFCDKYPKFYDDEFVFYSKNMSELDNNNILNIRNLYYLTRDFAKNHFIVSNQNDDMWDYYILRYNNYYYKIGIVVESIYCCRENNTNETFINFAAIEKYQRQRNNPDNEKKIYYLRQVLNNLVSSGLSPKMIENETKSFLRKRKI